jgi:hypothetical protein
MAGEDEEAAGPQSRRDAQTSWGVSNSDNLFGVNQASFCYEVSELKKVIQTERERGILKGVDPNELVLWKVALSLSTPFVTRSNKASWLTPLFLG